MAFDPNNHVIQLCLRAMGMEEKGNPTEAHKLFHQAWEEAANDFEKFIAAHFVARHQINVADRLKWFQTALQFALKVNDDSVKPAFQYLYTNIAKCYHDLGDIHNAIENQELAGLSEDKPSDRGPFYHGTKADLHVGAFLTAGYRSNYNSEMIMNHIYFTALVDGAGLAAALAGGEGIERVYIVEPMGKFENDPNVTNKKFPGNPTRSYRTVAPLKIIDEVKGWVHQTPGEIQKWREKLADNKGDIIN